MHFQVLSSESQKKREAVGTVTRGIGLILVGKREKPFYRHITQVTFHAPLCQLHFPYASQCNAASPMLLKALTLSRKSVGKMNEMHFPQQLKNCVWGNGRPQCCKVWHQSYVYGHSIPKQRKSQEVCHTAVS